MNTKELINEVRELMSKFNFNTEVKMESATLTDGTVIQWDGAMAVGTPIMVVTADGVIPAPDGTLELEGGTLITIVNGAVTEIVEPAEGPAPQEEMAKEFATVEKFNEVVSDLESKITALAEQFESISKILSSHSEAFSKTVDLVEKIADLPSEAPANVDQTKISKKDEKFANIVKLAQQLKK